MTKLLIKIPEKSDKSNKIYNVKDISKDYHMEFGFITKEDLNKPSGTIVKSNTGKEFSLVEPNFFDHYKKINRGPQIIPLKDIGAIIAFTGLGKDSVVVEGGGGSGGLGCFLANIVKQVTSYEIREDHVKIINKNIKKLNINNQTVKLQDMSKGIDEKDVDVVIIDLPSPWIALESAMNAVKPGGFIVSYSPNTTQSNEFCNNVAQHNNLLNITTHEIIDRQWVIDQKKVHPISRQAIHSGFITIIRKL